ncbi:hypothetical protein NE237_015803 [Protea cynaroides]|uniref:Uncharacterized protein n=1 Tax=Protea cynaroides TaxID=273540 RepID=A0A9Q0QRD4_9MAGN|nr:hypothetical protein NE237_015803 [Protea cynaroides]
MFLMGVANGELIGSCSGDSNVELQSSKWKTEISFRGLHLFSIFKKIFQVARWVSKVLSKEELARPLQDARPTHSNSSRSASSEDRSHMEDGCRDAEGNSNGAFGLDDLNANNNGATTLGGDVGGTRVCMAPGAATVAEETLKAKAGWRASNSTLLIVNE